MKLKQYTPTFLLFGLCLSLPSGAAAQSVPGIPEPGLLVYGQILDRDTRTPVAVTSVVLQAQGGGDSVSLPATLIGINGQTFYLVRLPFETRSAGGQTFDATANTLGLATVSRTYSRAATCDGQAATFSDPSKAQFNFGLTDRGRVERADLLVVGKPPVDRHDSDGDGVPDAVERAYGTNPLDASDYPLWLSSDLELTGAGLVIKWASKAGKSYTVSRATALAEPAASFEDRPDGVAIPSEGNQTTYLDKDAFGPGPYFYRIMED